MSQTSLTPETAPQDQVVQDAGLVRLAIAFTGWAERWFPDAYIFVAIAVAVVSLGAMANGASPVAVSEAFGDGFWSLITFTMQMAFIVIGGYVVATSAPAQRLIRGLARLPQTGRGAVGLIAASAMIASLLNWGFSLIVGGLLARTLAERRELRMDYRAAGAAAYLGLGATWAMGLSSSAAQLQANPASMPKNLLAITGVIPFTETIFLWQSFSITAVLLIVSVFIAIRSAPGPSAAMTAEDMGIDVSHQEEIVARPQRPGDWLEYSPLLTILLVLLAIGWLVREFSRQSPILAISNLNTYNFIFLMAGLLLHWRPRRFLTAVVKSVPSTAGVLIQFPLYGAIAAILTQAKNGAGITLSDQIGHAFVSLSTQHLYPLVIGIYSAILGFFVPSGGGKWLLEAPYVHKSPLSSSPAPCQIRQRTLTAAVLLRLSRTYRPLQ